MKKRSTPPADVGAGVVFCSEYRHRSGKIMRAADYGYKAWRFLVRKRK